MDEKKMTLEDLIGWLDNNDVPYGIDDAGRLTVKGDLNERFRDWVKARKYTSLPDELVCVDGSLWLERTSMMSLGGLASVKGGLNLRWTPLASLGDLTSVQGYLDLQGAHITSLGNLASVGGSLSLQDTSITSLGNLISIGGWLNLKGTAITSLGSLASVGGWLDLQGAPITSLDDLPQVGEHLYLDQSQLQPLTREALQKVKGSILYRDQADEWWITWVTLSPAELETIVAENERRERLHNTRGSDVDWDLYDR